MDGKSRSLVVVSIVGVIGTVLIIIISVCHAWDFGALMVFLCREEENGDEGFIYRARGKMRLKSKIGTCS